MVHRMTPLSSIAKGGYYRTHFSVLHDVSELKYSINIEHLFSVINISLHAAKKKNHGWDQEPMKLCVSWAPGGIYIHKLYC